MFSCVSSGRFYFGGLFAPPASPLPFPARKHASFLPRALEGAACLKPGDAAPRRAQPRRRPPALGLRCAADSSWGSSAARRCRLRSLPAPGPGHRRRPPITRPARSACSFFERKAAHLHRGSSPAWLRVPGHFFEIFPGGARRLPGFQGDSGRGARGARRAGEQGKSQGLAEAHTETRTYSTSLPPCLPLFDVRFRTCGGYWNRVGGFCS